MDCPACKGVVVVVEHERIEIDYCTKCFGVWLDAGELELLLERLALDGSAFAMDVLMSLPAQEVAEKARPCPICRKKMRKVLVGAQPVVLVDVCPRGHGLWLDSGEVHRIIEQVVSVDPHAIDKESKVVAFLGKVFKAVR